MRRYPLPLLFLAVAFLGFLSLEIPQASAGPDNENSIDYLAPAADWFYESGQLGADLGYSVHAAGRLNDDPYDDIVIGAPQYIAPGQSERDGAVFVFFGSASTLSPLANTPDLLLSIGGKGSRFGDAVSAAGDVNGDGYDDLLVGANEFQVPFDDKSGVPKSGAVFLYLGSKTGPNSTADWSVIAEAPEIQFGAAVSTAGDVNADGFDDILVGAPNYESATDQPNEGKIYLFLGSELGLSASPDWVYECDKPNAQCGYAVGAAGDLNRDGFDDVVVGAPHYEDLETGEGAALVFLGSAAGLMSTPHRVLESNQPGAGFGTAVGGAADLDGDTYDDLVVGAPEYDRDDDHVDFGAVYIYRGSETGIGSTFDWRLYGPEAYDRFGHDVDMAGDINADGFGDLLVGAYLFGDYGTTDQPDEGAVFLYTGGPAGLALAPRWSAYGDKAEAWFGFSAAPAGDVNADGGMDVIIGAPNYRDDQRVIMGRAFVYLNTLEEFQEYYYHVFIPVVDN